MNKKGIAFGLLKIILVVSVGIALWLIYSGIENIINSTFGLSPMGSIISGVILLGVLFVLTKYNLMAYAC